MDINTAPAMVIGLLAALALLAMLGWSIAKPEKRLWPPKKSTRLSQIVVWTLTIAVFASAFVLGIADWNRFQWPATLRWGLGVPLILAGHWIVWGGVANLGLEATSGAVDTLKTGGLYRYSRNPQYVADIGILAGWAVLSGSGLAAPVVMAGIVVLLSAPFAEEPWLDRTYGAAFRQYCKRTRRYI